eukprot:COSAG02_NODE_6272_length_3689_cov_3.250418_1_plen_88_part_10
MRAGVGRCCGRAALTDSLSRLLLLLLLGAVDQVASRKVKQLIVLVDKMEQAQSALELKLRGTEVSGRALRRCAPEAARQASAFDGRTF